MTDEREASPYEVIQKLVSHGHTKEQILNEYSIPELRLFYEKIVSDEMRQQADFIDGVVAGIGGAFGGYKQLQNSLTALRKGVSIDG